MTGLVFLASIGAPKFLAGIGIAQAGMIPGSIVVWYVANPSLLVQGSGSGLGPE